MSAQAFIIARKELSEKPSQLLLPKPPVKGSKIFLERIDFIWRRLSFTHKVTARNIFRYKQRMLMTIFGVAGSVALLFAGLGIQSSLGKIIDNQFSRLMPYDMIVVTNGDSSQKDLMSVLDSKKVSKYQSIYLSHVTNISHKNQKENKIMRKNLKAVAVLTGALVLGGVIGWALNLVHIEPAVSCSVIAILSIALQEAIRTKFIKRA